MQEKHIKEVSVLEKEAFSSPWSENALREEITNPVAFFFVCTDENEKVLAYIGGHIIEPECFIANIAVFREFRRMKIASNLLSELIMKAKEKECETITLEVRESNESAVSFYEKEGFKLLGKRKNFYTAPNEDALIYTKYLN